MTPIALKYAHIYCRMYVRMYISDALLISLTVFAASSISPDAYLCSGLDLYLTIEPDLFSSMALVHSRIRRVFFCEEDREQGALLSGSHRIHCLPALNHHYRVFKVCANLTPPVVDDKEQS